MSDSLSDSLSKLSELSESSRAIAWERYQILRPHLEDAVPLSRTIEDADIPLRTAQRWVANYLKSGLTGLCRSKRKDGGTHKILNAEVQKLIEGLALQKPAMTKATIHRRVKDWCVREEITPPSYETVYGIIRNLDPALMTLAHEGTKAYKQAFDLLHRHNAEKSNAIWQVDHTLLDIWIFDEKEQPIRPWLTVIMDDYSRAIAGYYISFDAPSALQTALALKQGIWRKNNPAWHICGIPEILYTDHGSDFTSHHIEQVCLDLKIQLIFSTIGEPRGRGKIERFFRTVNQLLLAKLPGYAPPGHKSPNPVLNFALFEREFESFLLEYHQTEHSQTKEAPQKRWDGKGFLPQLPELLEKLDLLLLTIKDTRRIQRDGIKFQGLRYTDPLLANYDDTKAFSEQQSFLVTKEYRRFAEFCDACRREEYIGLCYGAPGVGKTLSARYYTKWFFLETRLQPHLPYAPLRPEIEDSNALLYTASVSSPPRLVREKIRSMRVELGRLIEEFSIPGQQDTPSYAVSDCCKLIIVDETERLSLNAIEQFREIYDRGGIGLIFVGMPGLEKRLARYPQLYSRIGFAHNYRALSQSEMRFLLENYWSQINLSMNPNDFTDAEAIASIARITNGNFRLLNRLFRQIQRVIKINELNCITAEVVEAARECLVIGTV